MMDNGFHGDGIKPPRVKPNTDSGGIKGMKAAVSCIWLVFVVLFLFLGFQHWSQSKRDIPLFPTPERPELNKLGRIKIAGQDLDKPIKEFAANFNVYLSEQNTANREANRRSAWGYFFAALTAFVSIFLEWRDAISSRLKSNKCRPSEVVQQNVGEPTSDSGKLLNNENQQT